jgi:hypothetical protein
MVSMRLRHSQHQGATAVWPDLAAWAGVATASGHQQHQGQPDRHATGGPISSPIACLGKFRPGASSGCVCAAGPAGPALVLGAYARRQWGTGRPLLRPVLGFFYPHLTSSLMLFSAGAVPGSPVRHCVRILTTQYIRILKRFCPKRGVLTFQPLVEYYGSTLSPRIGPRSNS